MTERETPQIVLDHIKLTEEMSADDLVKSFPGSPNAAGHILSLLGAYFQHGEVTFILALALAGHLAAIENEPCGAEQQGVMITWEDRFRLFIAQFHKLRLDASEKLSSPEIQQKMREMGLKQSIQ
jgi:hypothetical protein